MLAISNIRSRTWRWPSPIVMRWVGAAVLSIARLLCRAISTNFNALSCCEAISFPVAKTVEAGADIDTRLESREISGLAVDALWSSRQLRRSKVVGPGFPKEPNGSIV